jgi:hypothetical protein
MRMCAYVYVCIYIYIYIYIFFFSSFSFFSRKEKSRVDRVESPEAEDRSRFPKRTFRDLESNVSDLESIHVVPFYRFASA